MLCVRIVVLGTSLLCALATSKPTFSQVRLCRCVLLFSTMMAAHSHSPQKRSYTEAYEARVAKEREEVCQPSKKFVPCAPAYVVPIAG